MKNVGAELYEIRKDVKCIKCGNKGAVKSFGKWYPNGLGEKSDNSKALEEYKNEAFMDYEMGMGGTRPHECLNCGNTGLIDIDSLECYVKAFETIK